MAMGPGRVHMNPVKRQMSSDPAIYEGTTHHIVYSVATFSSIFSVFSEQHKSLPTCRLVRLSLNCIKPWGFDST